MSLTRTLCCLVVWSTVILLVGFPAAAQGGRGKAQLNTPQGDIVIDYGRPQLKGRDPLTWQETGSYWRMGNNEMTTLSTPVDLAFGATKVAKGTYGLWLAKVAPDRYELVFNSQNSGMVMTHDKAKDVATVPLAKEAAPAPVESFTIELNGGPSGGTIAVSWGPARLSAGFRFAR